MVGNNNTLVSVCIPAYNHEKYIEKCLQSIIDQSYENIELIVVDDGSKDETWKKILSLKEKCEKRFKKVIFEHQENQGSCTTLNRTISSAQGKYIYIIASDDLSKPNAIKEQIEFLENNPEYVLCVGDNEIINNQDERIAWGFRRKEVPFEEGFQTFAAYLQNKERNPDFNSVKFGSYSSLVQGNYITNGYLIRKDTFDKIGGFKKEAPLEDLYLMLQLSKYGKFKFIDKILFSYRWHEDNTTKKKEKMEKFQRQTMLYEEKLLKEKYPHLLDEFYRLTVKRKGIVKLGSFFEIYKEKNLSEKFIKLVLFALHITLYKKKLK